MTDYSDFVIPREYAEQIGYLAIETALVDNRLKIFLAVLTAGKQTSSNVRRAGEMKRIEHLIGGQSFEILINRIDKMFRLRIKDERLISEFDSVKSVLTVVSADRGKYMHSYWFSLRRSDNFRQVRRGVVKPGELREHEVSLSSLMEAVDNVRHTGSRRNELIASEKRNKGGGAGQDHPQAQGGSRG